MLISTLARRVGTEYYHFLQPNQYLSGSKPLTNEEMSRAFDPGSSWISVFDNAYPQWTRLGADLKEWDVNFFDLMLMFKNNYETLYRDPCCHFNKRGYELIAGRIWRDILDYTKVAKLRTHTFENQLRAVTTYGEPVAPLWDIYLQEDEVIYLKQPCDESDIEAPFMLHLIPADITHLPHGSRASGLVNSDFHFEQVGWLIDHTCLAKVSLPPYPITALRTGQHIPGEGHIWQITVPVVDRAETLLWK